LTTISFIHTADLHLDSPFKGMTGLPLDRLNELRESTFTAFTSLVDYAVESKPDFMLIVGDIYDGEDRSLRAQLKFQEGMEKLNAADVPVFISYGNHDHLGGRWTRFDLPSNVHVFEENVEEARLRVRGLDVSIFGFSYKERHIREAMIEHFPVANTEAFNIGMLHGSLAGDVSHAVYAPFTKEQLLEKRYDYWALGHIHLRQQLHAEPPIVYPGNIQGRHKNERGVKGFYEVELSKMDASFSFVPTSALIFERLNVTCVGIRHANEWLEACLEVLESFKRNYGAGVVELTMTAVDEGAAELFRQSSEEEWLGVLREVIEKNEPFIFVQKIIIEEQIVNGAAKSAFAQSVLSVIEDWTIDEWKMILKEAYQHKQGIKYLDVLDEMEIDLIKIEATSLLMNEMSKTE